MAVSAAEATAPEAAALLLDGLLSCAEAIDLSECSLPVSELGAVYTAVLHDHPELFHVAARLSYTYRTVTVGGRAVNMTVEVYPAYTMTGDGLTAARGFYRDTVAGILAEMEAAFGGRAHTEAEVVLFLHDTLADRYAYDTRPEGMTTAAPNADAYTFFRDGVGICQAYALAFLALCRGAGLEAELVTSAAMDHAWNHVRVDGVWYHVDVTRDDPIPAAGGQDTVTHDRLLRSDAGMAALGYHDYACAGGHLCTDTRYEAVQADETSPPTAAPTVTAVLTRFHQPLTVTPLGWAGMTADGTPTAIRLNADGTTLSAAGDMDLDGVLTPADLLTTYAQSLPEPWRAWFREQLVAARSSDTG